METKHPKLEKSDQTVWSLEEEDVSIHSKSYTCSFCKKGFSTAQALGGHMNIHRKDRAKLRESFEENVLSSDVTLDRVQVQDRPLVSGIISESSGEKKASRDDNGSGASPRGKDGVGENSGSSHGSSSQVELDLELRLGPDSRAS